MGPYPIFACAAFVATHHMMGSRVVVDARAKSQLCCVPTATSDQLFVLPPHLLSTLTPPVLFVSSPLPTPCVVVLAGIVVASHIPFVFSPHTNHKFFFLFFARLSLCHSSLCPAWIDSTLCSSVPQCIAVSSTPRLAMLPSVVPSLSAP